MMDVKFDRIFCIAFFLTVFTVIASNASQLRFQRKFSECLPVRRFRVSFIFIHLEADAAAVHRAENLDIADGIQTEAARDAGFDQLDDARNCGLGIISLDKIEVALLRHLPDWRLHADGVEFEIDGQTPMTCH